MPWKNGGGSTTEIAIYPAQSSVLAAFSWRLSLAQLDGSGPFSTFPGYDRCIVQLSGKPMRLVHEGRPEKQLLPFVPYLFQGEWITQGLLDGKAEDFNLMVRRDQFKSRLDCVRLKTGEPFLLKLADIHLIWVNQGYCQWSSEGRPEILMLHDTLILEEGRAMSVALTSDDAILFIASLSKKA